METFSPRHGRPDRWSKPQRAPGHPQLLPQEWRAPSLEPCRACFSFPVSPGLGSAGTSQTVAMATADGPDAAEKVLWIPEGSKARGHQSFLQQLFIECLLCARRWPYCNDEDRLGPCYYGVTIIIIIQKPITFLVFSVCQALC